MGEGKAYLSLKWDGSLFCTYMLYMKITFEDNYSPLLSISRLKLFNVFESNVMDPIQPLKFALVR